MKATQVLMEEHQVILRVLKSLEAGADRLAAGQPIRSDFFLEAASFIKGFADGCHHKKEEGVLFVKMEQNGVQNQGGPIGMMLAEHEQGRVFTRGMHEAAQRWQSGDASAAGAIEANARNYVNLLRQHIYKEDMILFPMADRAIPSDQQEAVWQGFEHVEHEETGAGVHEKYLALAESLEMEVASI